jgi:hypothetical protein
MRSGTSLTTESTASALVWREYLGTNLGAQRHSIRTWVLTQVTLVEKRRSGVAVAAVIPIRDPAEMGECIVFSSVDDSLNANL